MIARFLLITLFFIEPFLVFTQVTVVIRGQVKSRQDAPVEYANVSVKSKNIGTCADGSGAFDLTIPVKYSQDTVFVSAVGYESVKIPISDFVFNQTKIISLDEKVYELPEFEIESTRLRTEISGKTGKNKAWGYMVGENGGAQFGRLFNPRSKPVIIEKVHVLVANSNICEGDKSKLRLRVYSLGDSKSESDLLHENLFIEVADKAGWQTIDLSHFNITTNQRFMIGFEWLFDEYTCPIMVAIGGKGSKSFYRLSSHAAWNPTLDMNWAIQATLLMEE